MVDRISTIVCINVADFSLLITVEINVDLPTALADCVPNGPVNAGYNTLACNNPCRGSPGWNGSWGFSFVPYPTMLKIRFSISQRFVSTVSKSNHDVILGGVFECFWVQSTYN